MRSYVGWTVFVLVIVSWTFISLDPMPTGTAAELSPPTVDLDTDPHLCAWWTMDESSGTTVKDSSSKGHPGTLLGGLTMETSSEKGKHGRALRLDGDRSHYVRAEGFKGVSGTKARTIAAWIKTDTSRGEIVSWGQDEGGKMWILGFIRSGLGVTPKGGYLYTLQRVHDDAWHHVAAVVGESESPNLHDDVTLYIDGKVAEIDDIGLLDLWPIETGSDLDVRIGLGFKGVLDDVRVYDRPLSKEEIGRLHDGRTKAESK